MGNKAVERLLALNLIVGMVFALVLVSDLGRPMAPYPAAAGETESPSGGDPAGGDLGPSGAAASGWQSSVPGGSTEDSSASGAGQMASRARAGTSAVPPGATIKVGGIFSETGPLAAGAEANTVKAYFQMVNAQGGVHGRKIQLVELDDGFDVTRGINQARQLVQQEKVFAIVGWLAPNTEPPAADYFESVGMPVVGGLGVPQEFGKSLSFPTTVNLGSVGKLCKWVLGAARGMKHPAAWFVDLSFIAQALGPTVQCLKDNGSPPVESKTISASEPDYSAHVLQARAKNADSLFLGFDPFSYVRIFQALQQQNWHPEIYAWGMTNTQSLAAISSDSLEMVGTSSPTLVPFTHPNNPEMALYTRMMKKYYPNTFLDPYTVISWAAAKVFVEGLRRTGPDLSRAAFVKAMNSMRGFRAGVISDVTYTPTSHDPHPCTEGLRYENGRWRDTYPYWLCLDGTRPFPPE